MVTSTDSVLLDAVLRNGAEGGRIGDTEALRVFERADVDALSRAARLRRDRVFGELISYSPKVFIPVTELCRDVCHYCTFAKAPRRVRAPYMSVDAVLDVARRGAALGCREALFTLGDRPESRYRVAREALDRMGFESTLHYVAHLAQRVLDETGLLPHINPGVMSHDELKMLRPAAASMGVMLESASERLCERGQAHFGSPDKRPQVRLDCIDAAGALDIVFTSGILIGIGETRRERVESLIKLRELHERHGHLQEIIVQNFKPKADTLMANAVEPTLADYLWTISVARLLLPTDVSVQAPPNLSPDALPALIDAGINDWGGVSPLTADYVNPEAPWPAIERLREVSFSKDKILTPRLTVYPRYVREQKRYLDPGLHAHVNGLSDADGYARENDWTAGAVNDDRLLEGRQPTMTGWRPARDLVEAVERAEGGETLSHSGVERLFAARGPACDWLFERADALRQRVAGDTLTYVVNRNINYTNMCYFSCRFCAFSKGDSDPRLRGAAYDLPLDEITRRVQEAWDRGATEVCLQGGIHPNYTGETYLDICRAIKSSTPNIHIHAFSPLEVWHGATTLGLALPDYLARLKDAGLGSLPGTAAEILDDSVRAIICPDKIDTKTWLEVMYAAHGVGLRTTATIMFGHLENSEHWAHHLLRVRELQQQSGGFTEFVPLPFVHMEAPIHRTGLTRPGPTWREATLMHAVARLVLNNAIDNIQASWVKLGANGVARIVDAGVNDLGGSLMNESITRAAGAAHGEEFAPAAIEALARDVGRPVRQRTTLYQNVPQERIEQSKTAATLTPIQNSRIQRGRPVEVDRPQRFGLS